MEQPFAWRIIVGKNKSLPNLVINKIKKDRKFAENIISTLIQESSKDEVIKNLNKINKN